MSQYSSVSRALVRFSIYTYLEDFWIVWHRKNLLDWELVQLLAWALVINKGVYHLECALWLIKRNHVTRIVDLQEREALCCATLAYNNN